MGAHQRVEKDRAEQPIGRIDDEDLEEIVRQLVRLGLAEEIQHLARRPERRHGDERRLHQAAGRALGGLERAAQHDALMRRQRLEDLRLLLGLERLEKGDGVVALELAHRLGERLDRQLLENVLARRSRRPRSARRKSNSSPISSTRRGPRLMVEQLDQRAEVGLVQRRDQRPHGLGIAPRRSPSSTAATKSARGSPVSSSRKLLFRGRRFFMVLRHMGP